MYSQAWTQYFYMATWIWTLCYAIDMKLLLGDRSGHPTCYHAFAWICPAILTTFGLAILYVPDAKSVSLFNNTVSNFLKVQLHFILFFQLPQFSILVHCHTTYSAKLLCYLCSFSGSYDSKSRVIFRVDARSSNRRYLQFSANNRERKKTGANDTIQICVN